MYIEFVNADQKLHMNFLIIMMCTTTTTTKSFGPKQVGVCLIMIMIYVYQI
jgi:hypothetical protein